MLVLPDPLDPRVMMESLETDTQEGPVPPVTEETPDGQVLLVPRERLEMPELQEPLDSELTVCLVRMDVTEGTVVQGEADIQVTQELPASWENQEWVEQMALPDWLELMGDQVTRAEPGTQEDQEKLWWGHLVKQEQEERMECLAWMEHLETLGYEEPMDALETEVQQETQVPLGSVHQEKTELLDHQDLQEERDSEEITVETETQDGVDDLDLMELEEPQEVTVVKEKWEMLDLTVIQGSEETQEALVKVDHQDLGVLLERPAVRVEMASLVGMVTLAE